MEYVCQIVAVVIQLSLVIGASIITSRQPEGWKHAI